MAEENAYKRHVDTINEINSNMFGEQPTQIVDTSKIIQGGLKENILLSHSPKQSKTELNMESLLAKVNADLETSNAQNMPWGPQDDEMDYQRYSVVPE